MESGDLERASTERAMIDRRLAGSGRRLDQVRSGEEAADDWPGREQSRPPNSDNEKVLGRRNAGESSEGKGPITPIVAGGDQDKVVSSWTAQDVMGSSGPVRRIKELEAELEQSEGQRVVGCRFE